MANGAMAGGGGRSAEPRRSRARTADARLRKSEERQAFLLRLSDALRPLGDAADIQGEVTRLLRERFDVGWCYYLDFNEELAKGVVLRDAHRESLTSLVGTHDLSDIPQFIEHCKSGQILIVPNYAASPLWSPRVVERYGAMGIKSLLGAPLLKGGGLRAMLLMTDTKERDWSEDAVILLGEVADRTWDAVERARAEAALKGSEMRLRLALDAGQIGEWELDLATDFSVRAPRHDLIFGYDEPVDDWGFETFLGHVVPEDRASVEAAFRNAAETGVGWNFECRIRRANDGEIRWIAAHSAPQLDAKGHAARLFGTVQDITEQRRAEAALRTSERLLAAELAGTQLLQRLSTRLIPEQPPEVLHEQILDAALELMQADAVSIQLLVDGGERLRRLATRNLHPDSTEYWTWVDASHASSCGQALRTNSRVVSEDIETVAELVGTGDLEAFRASGTRAVQSTPLVTRAGKPIGMISTHWRQPRKLAESDFALFDILARQVADLLERSETEEALRDSEERLRQFGDASQDVLWARDTETLQWTRLTSGFDAIYGLSREEVLAGENYRNWLDLIVPEDRDHAKANIDRVRAGERVAFEFRIRRPSDGAIRWVRDTDFPIIDKTGKIGSIGGIGSDVTELREAEQRLQALLTGIPQLVWRAAGEGRWTWASPQWTDFTGKPEAESHGLGWLDPVHPDDREQALAAWALAPQRGNLEVGYRMRDVQDGAYRWFQTRATPVRGRGGRIIEWLGTSTDIDQERRFQDRQQVLVAELQHRVRNILAVVRAVFTRTRETAGDSDEMVDHFKGRLDALARTQVMTTHNLARTVDLECLLRDELLSVGVSDGPRVTFSGPEVTLDYQSAESMGLAIHELTTNALKFGALSTETGKLDIAWKLNLVYGEQSVLDLIWTEQGVPAVPVKPSRKGFGRELIEEALPYRLGAQTKLEFKGNGVRCSISVPLSAEGADTSLEIGQTMQ